MKQIATVKNVLLIYEKDGIDGVKTFLDNADVQEMTWPYKIKELIDKNCLESVEEEIKLVSFNINLERELYKLKNKENGENTCNCK